MSLQNTNYSSSGLAYNALPNTGNSAEGDDKLYLKGGEGSLAVISLFETPGELESIRKSGWLVNEANLVFHIDAAAMSGNIEPQRLYVYDLKNNRPIVDYFLDGTTNSLNPKKDKIIFDGNLITNATTKKGTSYKIRITNHIRNLIKFKDSTNIKLGLVVTEDINNPISYKVKTPSGFITGAPKPYVMNPLGTILYGGKTSADDKRLKLEIIFTKPN